ncbi:MAG: cob(I)yrinic acid a,c-diamide adenosyltransferase [Candidatus Marinimicrobia bacterium]|nr:cob(I)yrinic acid a,c-diamide adenosyltransferase [Candidatus Neomarinimicrobiota bacterium]MBL7023692.1 cob(I)yrinic acid a,c-diamide adenosyltransferase [Candidatus Neomarinimicrobiota bacterium]
MKNKSKITISKIYTKAGDSGTTHLVGGQKLPKDNIRIEAYGMVDELNSVIGGCREKIHSLFEEYSELKSLHNILLRVQNELFTLGSVLATLPEDIHPKMQRITKKHITKLESEIDKANDDLSVLKSFVLPGGSELNVWLHLARSVCRRAERRCVTLSHKSEIDNHIVIYLNRLSDALFVWSRWVNFISGADEELWGRES